MRLLLYSHDSCGLGHLRRTMTIANEVLALRADAHVIVVTGSPVATRFREARGAEIIKLPCISKSVAGAYVSPDLDVDAALVARLRGRIISSVVDELRPDALLVDHKPVGLLGELLPALDVAQRVGTRCVIGLRDVIDEPNAVEREWGRPEVQHALSETYEAAFVYGDRNVFETLASAPSLAPLREKAHYTGYVVRRTDAPAYRPVAPVRPQVIVTVGGGQDGAERVEFVLAMLERFSPAWDTRIVLGPLLDGERARAINRRALALPGVEVLRDHDDLPRLLREADAVVAMAGYNTCAEIVQSRTPAVFLPRAFPRMEQTLRAERLQSLALGTTVHGTSLDELYLATSKAVNRGRIWQQLPSLDGARVAARRLVELVSSPRRASTDLPQPSAPTGPAMASQDTLSPVAAIRVRAAEFPGTNAAS